MRETFRLNLDRLRGAISQSGVGLDMVMYSNRMPVNVRLKDVEKDFEEFIDQIGKTSAE
jgi:hypothetical protein